MNSGCQMYEWVINAKLSFVSISLYKSQIKYLSLRHSYLILLSVCLLCLPDIKQTNAKSNNLRFRFVMLSLLFLPYCLAVGFAAVQGRNTIHLTQMYSNRWRIKCDWEELIFDSMGRNNLVGNYLDSNTFYLIIFAICDMC